MLPTSRNKKWLGRERTNRQRAEHASNVGVHFEDWRCSTAGDPDGHGRFQRLQLEEDEEMNESTAGDKNQLLDDRSIEDWSIWRGCRRSEEEYNTL